MKENKTNVNAIAIHSQLKTTLCRSTVVTVRTFISLKERVGRVCFEIAEGKTDERGIRRKGTLNNMFIILFWQPQLSELS